LNYYIYWHYNISRIEEVRYNYNFQVKRSFHEIDRDLKSLPNLEVPGRGEWAVVEFIKGFVNKGLIKVTVAENENIVAQDLIEQDAERAQPIGRAQLRHSEELQKLCRLSQVWSL